MTIKVVRRNTPGAHYIGRPSPLGNPFPMYGDESKRDEVCDKYEVWFRDKVAARDPRVMAELRAILNRAQTYGVILLGCYCAPRRCHGDTIARYLTEQQAKGRLEI